MLYQNTLFCKALMAQTHWSQKWPQWFQPENENCFTCPWHLHAAFFYPMQQCCWQQHLSLLHPQTVHGTLRALASYQTVSSLRSVRPIYSSCRLWSPISFVSSPELFPGRRLGISCPRSWLSLVWSWVVWRRDFLPPGFRVSHHNELRFLELDLKSGTFSHKCIRLSSLVKTTAR